jgi:threonine/homoserine/homoserine lactone efflux protein
MMSAVTAFLLAFVFSFIGTIPPGTLNLSVLQLGLENKMNAAWRFSLAAALVEYPYAWLAVKFEKLLTSSPLVIENFERMGAFVMIVLGLLNLFSLRKQVVKKVETKEYGFAKGLVLGILNPLAMPYWIGITAYLKSQHWLALSSLTDLHAYLFGVSLGALAFLILTAYLARKISAHVARNTFIKYIPAITLLALGFYGLISSLLLCTT